MKLKLLPYSLFILSVAILASCSQKAKVPVPEDAAIVVHIDGASLSSKLSWEEFKKGELYKLASTEIKDELQRRILDNPDSSGIDIKSDAYFFLKVRGRGGYAGFTVSIKDEKAFTNFIEKVLEKKSATEQDLSVIRDHDAVFTWNSKRLVIITNSPDINNSSFGKMSSYSERNFPEDSLLKFASEIYAIKKSNSINRNEKFATMMKEKGDIHFWSNSGKLMGSSLPAMLSLTKMSTLFDGNFTAATLNFDNGRIAITGKSFLNKDLAELYKKYKQKNLDEDMLKKIPSDNVTGVIAMSYPPEGLKDFFALLGVDGLLNGYLAEVGYSVDDFVKANKGDLMVAVTDFGMKQVPLSQSHEQDDMAYRSTRPDAKILFATSVRDKAAFQKLITLLTEKMGEGPESVRQMAGKIPYQLKEDWFLAGNDSASVNDFGSKSSNHSFISKISGHPMGVFVDIQKILAGFDSRYWMGADAGTEISDLSAKFWKDAVFYGGEYNNGDGSVDSHFEINLVDQNTNSLKQLNIYLGAIAKATKEIEEKERAKWENNSVVPDSAMALPPVK